MTTLLLLRHGPAEAPRVGHPDADRALTPEGRRRTQAAMKRLVGLGYTPERIFHSPYRRAVETAERFQAEAGGCPVEALGDLTPQGCPEVMATWILAYAAEHPRGTVALVSHEPLVSLLLHDLTGRPDELGLAGCAVLSAQGRGWRLERVLRPADGLA